MHASMLAAAIRVKTELLESADIENEQHFDQVELLRVLARIVLGASVEKAFGAPGDWGYLHPIGRALAANERSPMQASVGEG